MDDKSLNFNAEKILHTLFTPNVKGYDPDEVDAFLDKVIETAPTLSFHPNDCRGTVVISHDNFMKYLKAVGNTYEFLNLY